MASEKPYRFTPSNGDKKNTMLTIGLLLIVIVVIGAVLIFFMTPKPTPDGVGQIENETNVVNTSNVIEICDDACFYKLAVNTNDYLACQNLSKPSTTESCYEEISNSSFEACKLVSNETKRNSCVTLFAVADGNMELCNLLSDGKEECRLAIDPCDQSTNKPLCKALNTNDPSNCLSDNNCLLNYSLTKKDSEICNLISQNAVSKACISSIKATDKCYQLSKPSERDYCYQLYAVYSDDYLTCTEINPATSYALSCYSFFAAKRKELSICNIFQINDRWNCYTNYSLLSGDLAGCDAIDKLATTHLYQCAFEYAKKYGNPAACNLIETPSTRSTCYQGAIIYSSQNLNWQYCKDILNFDWMNKCYSESAKIYNNESICDLSPKDYAKQTCHLAYSVNKSETK